MGNTLTGQIVAETYEALLKVTDNGIITGTKKRITDGFGNDTPLLLSSTDVQIDGNFLLPGTTLQYVRGDGSLATFPTIISTLTTTGSSGASTLIGSTLNIPNYTLTGLGGVPTSRTLTINGTTFDLSANRSWTITDTGLTSVGISMPSAFTVSNSPLTANGTIAITGAGLASQYVRGDGTLANFPTTGGGGSSVSYYMNGSVNQGTILGNTYYEFNKTPIIGAGTDFTINANGYISQFITDANDPALLEIPGGNWNFEMYFSASSGGGSPSFYVELYKYNGTSFTLIASNSTTPEGITGGTAIDLYTTALAVPQTVLTLTDRLAIRVYVTHSGRTITLHTENSHLCQVITTFSTGITALNSLTKQVQYFAVGTSGTDFAISSATDTHTFNLPTASGTNRGALSSADWTTFNGKVPSTRTLTINGTAYDLSADRSWTISTGVSGSGTTNYVSKFTSSSAIGNSLIFDNGTNVGIGTASPTSKLYIAGDLDVRNSFSYFGSVKGYTYIVDDQINSYYSTDADAALNINYAGYNNGLTRFRDLQIWNGKGSQIAIFKGSTGNVGIGTSSPTQKFEIFQANNSTSFLLRNGTTSSHNVLYAGNDSSTNSSFIGSYKGDDSFYSNLVLQKFGGNVGIGTSSPSYKLDIRNDVSASTSLEPITLNLFNNNDGGSAIYFSNGVGAKSKLSFGVEGTGAGTDDTYLGFSTGAAASLNERMRIAANGNVGIGTTSPTAKLSVAGDINLLSTGAGIGCSTESVYFGGTTNGNYLAFGTNSVERARIANDGRFQVNNTGYSANCTATLRALSSTGTDRILECITIGYSSAFYVQTNGSYFFAGSNLSDARTKKDINYLEEYTLDKVMKLKPASFRYKENEENIKGGFIAQDVKEIFPDLVTNTKSDDEMMGVDYYGVIAILTKAIQEQQVQIEELKAKIK